MQQGESEQLSGRNAIEVIVVDDHLSVRKAVELLLAREGFRVAGVAGTVDEARALLERRRHDVALIDVQLGGERSTDLVAEILRRDPDAAIVLYTGLTGEDDGLREAASVGARGFVLKASPPARLVEALERVAGGGSFVDPELAHALAGDAELSRLDRLSPREREVLGLLAEGLTGEAIARRLYLSPETVRTHVRNATAKLGAKTRVQAVALAVRGRGGS